MASVQRVETQALTPSEEVEYSSDRISTKKRHQEDFDASEKRSRLATPDSCNTDASGEESQEPKETQIPSANTAYVAQEGVSYPANGLNAQVSVGKTYNSIQQAHVGPVSSHAPLAPGSMGAFSGFGAYNHGNTYIPDSATGQQDVVFIPSIPTIPAVPQLSEGFNIIEAVPAQHATVEVAESALTKRQLEQAEKQREREQKRLEREKQKDEERRLKIAEREKKKEEDRLLKIAEKEKKKEEERLLKLAEKERKEQEKQAKREALEKEKERKRELLEKEKERKREEKLKREEEKLKREEAKRKAEEEKQRKEEERKQKEEQKERNQMRISNFFAVKPTSTKRESTPPVEKPLAVDDHLYDKQFLPFFQKQNVSLASNGILPEGDLAVLVQKFDSGLLQKSDLKNFFALPGAKTETHYTSSEQMVEALNSATAQEADIRNLVQNLPPIKYLQFYENAKPPYVGTWCSQKHLATLFLLSNPLDTTLTGLDYNYDSDLDWDGDDDEGEDIDDLEEGDDEDEDVDNDDMDDFVEETAAKKRGNLGPLQSVDRWNDGSEESKAFFDDIKYERLDYEIKFPIDPMGEYWGPGPKVVSVTVQTKELFSVAQLGSTPVKSASTTPNVLTPQKPTIKDIKVLNELIEFVEKNCDFTIGTLSELAKREFKTFSKNMLKHTIQEIAVYNKKRWEVRQDTKARLVQELGVLKVE